MLRIAKEELAECLERQVECAHGGMNGLQTLLYGWKKYRKYGARYCHALEVRDWMYITEVQDLSEYAQVDLTKTQQDEFCGEE